MSNIFIKDNQVRALVSYLKPWDKNPRSIKEDNFTQLCTDVKKEQFKPLLILDDGTVLGGNMRIRAYQHNGQVDVWVSVITLREDGELVTAFVNGHEDQNFQSKLEEQEDGRVYEFSFLKESDTNKKDIHNDKWFRVEKILELKNVAKFLIPLSPTTK